MKARSLAQKRISRPPRPCCSSQEITHWPKWNPPTHNSAQPVIWWSYFKTNFSSRRTSPATSLSRPMKKAGSNCFRYWKLSEPGPKCATNTSKHSLTIRRVSSRSSLPSEGRSSREEFRNEQVTLEPHASGDAWACGSVPVPVAKARCCRKREHYRYRRQHWPGNVSDGAAMADPVKAGKGRGSPACAADPIDRPNRTGPVQARRCCTCGKWRRPKWNHAPHWAARHARPADRKDCANPHSGRVRPDPGRKYPDPDRE